jgi:hypothetical protein
MDLQILAIAVFGAIVVWAYIWYFRPGGEKPGPHHYVQFRKVFGHWPTTNKHLKKLEQVDVVDPMLIWLARRLEEANDAEVTLLREIQAHQRPFGGAKKEYDRVRAFVEERRRPFEWARTLANYFGFATSHYEAYLKMSEESGGQSHRPS